MSIRLRVKETINTLCRTCVHSQITTTDRGTHVFCDQTHPSKHITRPVTDCNQYTQTGQEMWKLEKMAWILEVKQNKVVGFTSPSSSRKKDE